MKKIRITLYGCDDKTEIEMEVTEEQLDFLNIISGKSIENSEYSCMPILAVDEIKEEIISPTNDTYKKLSENSNENMMKNIDNMNLFDINILFKN